MNRKTLAALKKSIKHWQDNVKNAKAEIDTSMHSEDCALCCLFNDSTSTSCLGCPVQHKTKIEFCVRTPFIVACDVRHSYECGGKTKEDLVAACKAEVDFLRSLLPKKRKRS